jgi:hypothetical protein
MKILSSVFVSFCLISAINAQANETNNNWYAGSFLGQATYNITKDELGLSNNSNFSHKTNLDDTGTALKLITGYQINKFFGLEAGYINLGTLNASYTDKISQQDVEFNTNFSAKIDGYIFNIIGQQEISDNINAYVKLGMFHWSSDAEFQVDIYSVLDNGSKNFLVKGGEKISGSGTDVFYGIGLSYDFDQISVRAEYESFSGDDDNIGVVSIGAVYKL